MGEGGGLDDPFFCPFYSSNGAALLYIYIWPLRLLRFLEGYGLIFGRPL